MMARVALGHTGRPLAVARPIAWGFGLISAAALVRVVAPTAVPSAYAASLDLSGALWSAAFAIFAVIYWPVLTRPRADGKPG